MDKPSKNKKSSAIQIEELLASFKRFKLKSKRSKKQASTVNTSAPAIETLADTSVTRTPITELAEMEHIEEHIEIKWTESLLSLPNELLEEICLGLHPLEVVRCRQVSKHQSQALEASNYKTPINRYLNASRSSLTCPSNFSFAST
jgi:hypothetical protein